MSLTDRIKAVPLLGGVWNALGIPPRTPPYTSPTDSAISQTTSIYKAVIPKFLYAG